MKTLLDAVTAAGAPNFLELPGPRSDHGLEIITSTGVSTDTLVVCIQGSIGGTIWATLTTVTFVAADFVAGGKMVFIKEKMVERIRANITSYESGHASRGTLTISAVLASGNTVTIGAKVYTFGTTMASIEGRILIGASAATSIENLSFAMTLGAGSGVKYACVASHPSATICTLAAGSLVIRARDKGVAGDSITTSATGASMAFGQTTLTGGVALGKVIVRYTPHPN